MFVIKKILLYVHLLDGNCRCGVAIGKVSLTIFYWEHLSKEIGQLCTVHTGLTPTRKSYRDSCWQFSYQALTGLGWLKNHVKVMGEREILNKSYKFS